MKAARILSVGLAASIVAVEEEVKVNVYDGPTECGEADKIKAFDRVEIHYTGTIDESSETGEPGKRFGSSRDLGFLLDATIGVGELIEGWDSGLIGLCRGAKATVVVPPGMGYGSSGVGELIPGGATLRFDVEVVSVAPPPPPPDLFGELDVDGDGVLTPGEIHAHFRKEGPGAEMPPDLMAQEDKDGDGVVSREEFGGPRMAWDMCLEMLHHESEPTVAGLAVEWLCHRPLGLEPGEQDDGGKAEL